MCFHFQNVKGLVSVVFPFSGKHNCKQKSVIKNILHIKKRRKSCHFLPFFSFKFSIFKLWPCCKHFDFIVTTLSHACPKIIIPQLSCFSWAPLLFKREKPVLPYLCSMWHWLRRKALFVPKTDKPTWVFSHRLLRTYIEHSRNVPGERIHMMWKQIRAQ